MLTDIDDRPGNDPTIAKPTRKTVETLERALADEWNTICHFRARFSKWKMSAKTGMLEEAITQNKTSWTSDQGRPAPVQQRSKVASLRTNSGQLLTVHVQPGARMITGRRYVVLYVGPQDGDEGVPALVLDLHSGDAIKTTGNPFLTYSTGALDKLFAALLVGMTVVWVVGLFALYDAGFGLGGTLLYLASIVAGMKLMMWPSAGYKKALADARAFFKKYRDKMI